MFVDQSILSKDIDELKFMSLSNRIIVVVVSGSNFNTASSKVHLNHLVSNNYNFSIRNERVNQFFAN